MDSHLEEAQHSLIVLAFHSRGGHDGLTDCLLADMMDRLDCTVGACSRERGVQTDGAGVSP